MLLINVTIKANKNAVEPAYMSVHWV